eukprot:PITA_21836
MTELVDTKPSSFEEVVEKPIWVDEMVEEYKSIVKKNVWEVVLRPAKKLIVGSRWIFMENHAIDISIEKYKAKFVSKGYSQVDEIDDEDTFDHVARSFKKYLAREFEMKDMGLMHYFLGLEVWKGDGELFVSRGKYDNEILQRFYMDSYKPMDTPLSTNMRKEDATSDEEVDANVYRQLVGSIM